MEEAYVFLSDSYFTRPSASKSCSGPSCTAARWPGWWDTRHGPADFGLEMHRALADLKHVLADVEFLEYQRRSFFKKLRPMAKAMLEELFRRFGPPGGRCPPQLTCEQPGPELEPESEPKAEA